MINKRYSVFLSHASQDIHLASEIFELIQLAFPALASTHYFSSYPDTGSPTGVEQPRHIFEAVCSSRCVVVLYTENYSSRPTCWAEVGCAIGQGIPIFVLRADAGGDIPFPITSRQYAQIDKGGTVESLLRELGRVLDVESVASAGRIKRLSDRHVPPEPGMFRTMQEALHCMLASSDIRRVYVVTYAGNFLNSIAYDRASDFAALETRRVLLTRPSASGLGHIRRLGGDEVAVKKRRGNIKANAQRLTDLGWDTRYIDGPPSVRCIIGASDVPVMAGLSMYPIRSDGPREEYSARNRQGLYRLYHERSADGYMIENLSQWFQASWKCGQPT